eukprot:COSAG02_NODE_43188_length_377_cov_0.794964_1_plen_74_part_01
MRALFAKEVRAQHFADTARARQAGEAAAGTADSRTTRCYQLVRPLVIRSFGGRPAPCTQSAELGLCGVLLAVQL